MQVDCWPLPLAVDVVGSPKRQYSEDCLGLGDDKGSTTYCSSIDGKWWWVSDKAWVSKRRRCAYNMFYTRLAVRIDAIAIPASKSPAPDAVILPSSFARNSPGSNNRLHDGIRMAIRRAQICRATTVQCMCRSNASSSPNIALPKPAMRGVLSSLWDSSTQCRSPSRLSCNTASILLRARMRRVLGKGKSWSPRIREALM